MYTLFNIASQSSLNFVLEAYRFLLLEVDGPYLSLNSTHFKVFYIFGNTKG